MGDHMHTCDNYKYSSHDMFSYTVCSATPCARFSFVSIEISVWVCLDIHKWKYR